MGLHFWRNIVRPRWLTNIVPSSFDNDDSSTLIIMSYVQRVCVWGGGRESYVTGFLYFVVLYMRWYSYVFDLYIDIKPIHDKKDCDSIFEDKKDARQLGRPLSHCSDIGIVMRVCDRFEGFHIGIICSLPAFSPHHLEKLCTMDI